VGNEKNDGDNEAGYLPDLVPGRDAKARAGARLVEGPGAAAVSATIEGLRKKGFGRLLIDDRAVPFDEVDPTALTDRSTLKVVVDRLQIGGGDPPPRLARSS